MLRKRPLSSTDDVYFNLCVLPSINALESGEECFQPLTLEDGKEWNFRMSGVETRERSVHVLAQPCFKPDSKCREIEYTIQCIIV
ncbi:hypothetical protein NQ315_000484 [Exocentrus adspersus]|uniref:Uncharacterized protein n=1 Tax=Exocentrus adspersus TaxID=1586481 RepID=A0AAV8VEP9_9CUCU|nr:hypothetical protein NQ315_000484 [Exocentrus adspersus]